MAVENLFPISKHPELWFDRQVVITEKKETTGKAEYTLIVQTLVNGEVSHNVIIPTHLIEFDMAKTQIELGEYIVSMDVNGLFV